MPLHPSFDPAGVWSFAFPPEFIPTGYGHVNYVQTPFEASAPLHSVTITFEVKDDDAQWTAFSDKTPATFRLFFEQKNDDLSSADGRWWAQSSEYDLGSNDNQVLTETIPLTSNLWTNVYGQHDNTAFLAALKNVGWFGLTFGGQDFAGHGNALISGSATFLLINYEVD